MAITEGLLYGDGNPVMKGDTCIGNSRNTYGITKAGVKVVVVEINYWPQGKSTMTVLVPNSITRFGVSSRFFDLVERSK